MDIKSLFKCIILSTLPILINVFSLKSQDLDSLEHILESKGLSNDEKLKIYDDLSWNYLNIDLKKSTFYAKKGIDLAEREKDTSMIIFLYRTLGVAYDMNSNFDTAIFYLSKSLSISQEIKDENMENIIKVAIGNAYNRQSLYNEALEYYLNSLTYFEKQESFYRVQLLLANIGSIYYILHKYDTALYYCLKAEELSREMGLIEETANLLTNLSGIYIKKNEYEKALEYGLKAYDIFEELGYIHSLALVTQQISRAYMYGFRDYDNAHFFADQGMIAAEEYGSPNLIAWTKGTKSFVYLMEDENEKSELLSIEALQIDSTDISLNRFLFGNIIIANIEMGNREKAIEYFEKYSEIMGYIADKEYQNSLSEMEIKYEAEKKELKIAALETEKEYFIWLGVAICGFLLAWLAFFLIKHRLGVSKRKLAEQQIKQLEQEKQLIATQAVLDGETAERTRIARDLHDGLGGMLSTVKLNLSDLKKGAVIENNDMFRFDNALNMLNDSIRELRRVAHNMMPESLSRYGLKISIKDFCDSIPGAEFQYFGDERRLNQKFEIMIYRIIHELVNNSIKHANAEHIIVQLIQESDRISLTVQDDGCGFDMNAKTKGNGLINIKNRVNSYNGQMSIWSKPGNGVEINIEFRL